MYIIELDISHESTPSEVVEFASNWDCTSKLLMENGPAGGNPLYEFASDNYNNLRELLIEYLGQGHGFDEEELKTMIVEV